MTILIWVLCALLVIVLVTNLGSVFIPAPGKSSQLPKAAKIARGVWVYHLKPHPDLRDPRALPVVYVPGPMFNPLSAEKFLKQYDYCDLYFADAPHGAGFFRRSLNRLAWAHANLVDHFHLAEANFVVGPGGGLILKKFIEVMQETRRPQVVLDVLLIDPSAIANDTRTEAAARFRKSTATENRLQAEDKLENWWSLTNRWRRGIEYFSYLSSLQTLFELMAAGKDDLSLFPMLKSLGIPYAVAHGANNEAYPVEEVYETLVPDYVSASDFHVIPKGIQQDVHLMPYTIWRVADPIIRNLQARAKR